MDRFSLQTPAELAGNFARNRFAEEIYNSPTYSVAVNICESCGHSCDRLTRVPEFDDMACCDQCLEDAMESLLVEAGATKAEASAFQSMVRRPIERAQGEMFPNFNPEVA